MLRFCGDESGINPESKFCVVAGFLGSVEQWSSLEATWSTILTNYGLECFHAVDIFAQSPKGPLRSPYREWGLSKTDKMLSDLANEIASHEVNLIGSAVVKYDFNKFSLEERRILTGASYNHKNQTIDTSGKPNHPYFTGLAFAVQHTTKVEASRDTIEFIMDQQNQYRAWAVDWYHDWEETAPLDVRNRLGGLSFQDKCRFVGLQTADLVAHLWNRYLNYGLTGRRLAAMEQLLGDKAEDQRRILMINSGVMNELIGQFPKGSL